ncbi:unnamed protein product [Ambrosiozyma monospora]|uniref:Unnamed protein product n=1 Tax=Ambrosiozyma monospora TaxID=43982 RepID=A0ACB5U0T7_AMBMO|nr:unnamed protein product [Ambrosiozyma monospora]
MTLRTVTALYKKLISQSWLNHILQTNTWLQTLKRIIIVVERTPVLFLFKFNEDGTLEFDKKYETKADIVSVASSDNDKLIVSIDDREQQLEIFTIKGEGELVKEDNESELVSEINRLNTSVVDSPEDVVPLFMIWYLRKRSEH